MKKYLITLLLAGFIQVVFAESLDKVVAIVNDKVITASEVEKQFSLLKQQRMAEGGNKPLPPDNLLKKQVLQHLINESLQLQLAKQYNLTVDGSDLTSALERIAKANNISVEQLKHAINSQGLDWKKYLSEIRKELLITRLQQKVVGKDVMVTPKQVEDYVKTAPQQLNSNVVYHLENIVIPMSDEPTSEQLKAARAKAFSLLAKASKGSSFDQLRIDESTNEFMLEGGDLGERHLAELPDLFAKEVVKMKKGQVVGPLRAGNGLQLIRLISETGATVHHEVTKYHVRQILLKQDISTPPAEAKRKAFNLYQQVKDGKDFAKIAKKYSMDTVSALKGGDMGFLNPEEVVPEFEKAMTSLPLHVVSKPVKSSFGWHIIEVLERKTEDDSESFKRQQVRQFLQQKKFAEAVQNWQQQLRNQSYIKIMEKELA